MLSQRLMLMLLSSTELMDMVDTVLDMPDTDMELTHMPMVDMDTHMPMELTTERDLLMLSQRLMLMLLSSMELMDMVDMVWDMPVTDMELTHMPLDMLMVVTHMPMELTTERDPLMQPEADAAYLYGAYGYGGYGLGYARYGYGYPYAYGGYGYPYAYGKQIIAEIVKLLQTKAQ